MASSITRHAIFGIQTPSNSQLGIAVTSFPGNTIDVVVNSVSIAKKHPKKKLTIQGPAKAALHEMSRDLEAQLRADIKSPAMVSYAYLRFMYPKQEGSPRTHDLLR